MAQTESISVVTLGLLLYSTMHLLTFDLTKNTSGRGGVSVFGAGGHIDFLKTLQLFDLFRRTHLF